MKALKAAALLLLLTPARAQVRLAPEAFSPSVPLAPAAALNAPSASLSSLCAPALTPTLVSPAALSASPLAVPAFAPAAAVAAPVAALAASPASVSAAVLAAPVALTAPAADPARPHPPAALPALRSASVLEGRRLNAFWDGFEAPEFDAPDAVFETEAARAAEPLSGAPFLALRDKRLAPAFERAIALARSAKSGSRALDAAEAALAGRVLNVDVRDLGRNYGEWDYLDDRLRLSRALFEPGREADLAGTIAHELTHVAQHALGLPSNALELEIEAHLLDLALMDELGLKTRPNTFSAQLVAALKKGPAAFVELIQAAVPGSPYLGEQSFAEIRDMMEQDYDEISEKSGARSQKLAAQIESDMRLLKTKKGRETYEAFSKRVRAELTRRAAAAR